MYIDELPPLPEVPWDLAPILPTLDVLNPRVQDVHPDVLRAHLVHEWLPLDATFHAITLGEASLRLAARVQDDPAAQSYALLLFSADGFLGPLSGDRKRVLVFAGALDSEKQLRAQIRATVFEAFGLDRVMPGPLVHRLGAEFSTEMSDLAGAWRRRDLKNPILQTMDDIDLRSELERRLWALWRSRRQTKARPSHATTDTTAIG